jgi:SAM-dependent methyltransferase
MADDTTGPGQGDDEGGRPRSAEWDTWRRRVDLDDYDERWARMAAAGQNPHGEADLVTHYGPVSVLDAGCGTGRVAVELDRRGIEAVGVDLDGDLLGRGRDKAPHVQWVHADLAEMDLGRTFDLVVAAGNVIGFVVADRRADAVAACARHLSPGGRLVAGFQLRTGWPTLDDYDRWCAEAGLELEDRFATWEREPVGPDPDYAVSVHRRPGG